MTNYERTQVDELRSRGLSFTEISKRTGIGVSALKMYISRSQSPVPDGHCLQCGSDLFFLPHKKQKKFCSDACRISWWNVHTDQLNHRSGTEQTCPVCGKPFTVSGNKKRIYCSRECYALARSKEAGHER